MSSLAPPAADRRSSIAARLRAAARAALNRARRGGIEGHVDEAREGVLHGWAWRRGAPGERLLVDVFVGRRFLGQTVACLPRRDLRDAGLGDGRYGFELLVGEGLPPDLAGVRAFALAEARVELAAPASQGETTRFVRAEDYLRATFAETLDAGALAQDAPGPATVEPSPRRWERLFARTADNAPTSYVAHIAAREGRAVAGLRETLRDYLLTYGRRRGRLRAPLARRDIELLGAGPTTEAPLAPGVAQAMLSRYYAAGDIEGAYLWAAYESAALAVEDCLSPDLHRGALATPDAAQAGATYPLSPFMRRFLAGSPCLRTLALDQEDGRRCAWLAMALFATAMPHLLRYMPPDWLARFTTPDARGAAPFDEAMAAVFGAANYDVRRWRADIARAGYDLARNAFSTVSPSGDRLQSPARAASDGPLVDVQLIGPFSRRLGISDSCRALAAALLAAGRTLRLCDYTLDHPNSARACDDLDLAQPGPARVTILHLNLEDIPSAVAYLPDVFTRTRLVGFPYLELSAPEPVHRLGIELVDEIWAASRFIAEALAPHAPTRLVGTACKPVRAIGRELARDRAYGALVAPGDFVFLTAGDALSGAHRKNPLGAIAAFRAAFPTDERVKLVIKTHSRARVGAEAERVVWDAVAQAARDDPRIRFVDRIASDDEMAALLEGADCLVSLHRAEGFGYHLVEAMALGTPVVATAYSGVLDFCTPQTAYLVDYVARPIGAGEYARASAHQTWAEPDLASAVAALRAVRNDSARRERVVAAARVTVERDFSSAALSRRVDARLAEILAGHAAEAPRASVTPP